MISRKCLQLTSRAARLDLRLCSTSTDPTNSETPAPPITAASKLQSAQQAIGYQFQKPELLLEALRGAGPTATSTTPEGNKQLALIGDKLLAFRLALLGRQRGERTGKSTKPSQVTA